MDPIPGPDDPITRLALEKFGIERLHPLQRMVVANILDAMPDATRSDRGPPDAGNEDGLLPGVTSPAFGDEAPDRPPLRQLVLLPTGFGKSLCFQLPSLLLPGLTLVVYPLLALMADQQASLASRGIPCAVFRGGLDGDERLRQEALVDRGGARLVITNPESLKSERLMRFLLDRGVSHVAVDEAHCVSEWGETFRPSYLDLGKVIRDLSPPAVSAFTATASPAVAEAVTRILFGGSPSAVTTAHPDRANIHFSAVRTLSPVHTLLRLVASMPKPLIVFCPSREGVQIVAELVAMRLDLDARFYHAGLERAEKTALEDWFKESGDGVLVATCAYGMGVDKRNIRSVVHYGAPASVEAYLQEAGRAGRDGLPARAVLVHPVRSPSSAEAVAGKTGLDEARELRRRAFLAYPDEPGCRRHALMRLMGAQDPPACAGCDACDGTASDVPEGLAELLRFFGANGRRLGLDQAVVLLGADKAAGVAGGARIEPPSCPEAGILDGWDRGDIRASVLKAIRCGYVARGDRFPWKGRIWLPRWAAGGCHATGGAAAGIRPTRRGSPRYALMAGRTERNMQ